MNFKLFTAGAAMSLLLLTACDGGNVTGKPISEAGVSTQTDSISYYEGMSLAGMAMQMTARDSTLKTDADKAVFLKAFSQMMHSLEGKSEAELAGAMLAMQATMQNQQMGKQFDLKFNNSMIATGLAYAIKADSLANSPEAMAYLQSTLQRIQSQKTEKDTKAAGTALAALGKQGYTKVEGDLYEKVEKSGTGAQVKDGDRLKVKMTMKDGAGKEVTIPMPEEVVAGQMFQGTPIAGIFSKMKIGEKASFAAPAAAVFRGGQSQVGIADDGIVIITVEVIGLAEAKAEAAAPAPTPTPVK